MMMRWCVLIICEPCPRRRAGRVSRSTPDRPDAHSPHAGTAAHRHRRGAYHVIVASPTPEWYPQASLSPSRVALTISLTAAHAQAIRMGSAAMARPHHSSLIRLLSL